MVAYIALWTICSNFAILLKNIILRTLSFIALWMDVTQTRRAVKALSNNWKRIAPSLPVKWLPSLAVIMLWTVTNAGNV